MRTILDLSHSPYSLFIMRRILIILACFSIVCCNKANWTQTTDGAYIYGVFPKNSDIVWKGNVIGPLVTGKGTIVILDKEGVVKESEDVEAVMGAITGYNYVPIREGQYLGKRKKGLPNGFGSLIVHDTLYLGKFKKGKLNSGYAQLYCLHGDTANPYYLGSVKKGVYHGQGSCFKDGIIAYQGGFNKGRKSGLGNEYKGGELIFTGSFKNDQREGRGKEYSNGILIYEGEWDNGLRDGQGTAYNERGVLWYSGGWKKGVFHGKGKLYEYGQCTEGKWEAGRLTKSISTSVFEEIGSATKMWLSDPDSLNLESLPEKIAENEMPDSQVEFIEQLSDEIESTLKESFDKRVEKRFGFWHLIRMVVQPWFKSDVKRANSAQKYFCKDVDSREIENLINAKIDFYNENTNSDKLQYVKLDKIPDGAIVDTNTAIKVFEREAMETTDVMVGILIDIVLCLIVAFIIGFIIGLANPDLLQYCGIVDTVMAVIAFGIGIYLSVFRTTAISIDLENTIKQMLVDNYMQFLDAQNVILQMIGLL